MNNLNTWKLICRSLGLDLPVMLLYVLESLGSSPGRRDFVMAVNAHGEMEGSLGGGIMEYKFVEAAKAKLAEQFNTPSIHRQIHNKTASRDQSGMICSGEQTILLYRVMPHDAQAVQAIVDCYLRCVNGSLKLSSEGIRFTEVVKEETPKGLQQNAETAWTYNTVIGYSNHLYIIGGGHCSLALSRIMHMMDFYIHLYDDRKDLQTMISNTCIHDSRVIEDYSKLPEVVPPGDNSYIVIMTYGYRTDAIALKALIDKEYRYIGLLGSKSKVSKMFEDLRNEAVPEERINKINAPVGIPINSHTPEEVAISIAAEIVKRKNLI